MKTLLLALALVAVAIVLLGVNALFRPHKGFPQGHAHDLAGIERRRRQLRALHRQQQQQKKK